MNVSTRTPEGLPSRCPLCNAEAAIEFSKPPGDGVCPSCGCLLWESKSILESMRNRIAEMLGVSPETLTADLALGELSELRNLGADSLETVELIMFLEEEFDVRLSDDAAEKIVTIADLVRYLEDHGNPGSTYGPAA